MLSSSVIRRRQRIPGGPLPQLFYQLRLATSITAIAACVLALRLRRVKLLDHSSPVFLGLLELTQGKATAGRFIQRAGVAENEHAYIESRLTAKGITWLAGEIAISKAKALLESK